MSDLPKLHIAVLMGGWANERPVSLMFETGFRQTISFTRYGSNHIY